MKKLNLDVAKHIAETKNGRCLSDKYINNATPMLWECSMGHCWYARLANVKNNNTWCPECNNISKRNGTDQSRKLAVSRGGKCLSKSYTNALTRLKWKCKEGHVWMARYNDVHGGQWCPYCAKKAKHNIEYCVSIAENKGGTCLSLKYKNRDEKLLWQCSDMHTWYTSLGKVLSSNTWCPECSSHKSQRILTDNIRSIFPSHKVCSNYTDFDWLLVNSKRKQELDIYIPTLKLAIEYDGRQHFMPVRFGGVSEKIAKQKFERTKELDIIKNESIKNHPNDVKYFIRFSYKEDIDDINYIKNKLMNCGVMFGGEHND